MNQTDPHPIRIAIIGMAGRFPGASSVAELWQNLCDGRESISHFSDAELEYSSGSANVKARGVLADPDLFDAAFFHFLPREAELTDPQQRVLLECAWLACEDAGYDPAKYPGKIGVFAGCSINTYLLSQLATAPGFLRDFTGNYQTGSFPSLVGNGQDFLATRISYKLGLRGPAMTVQSACSTSLVAVAQACDSLRLGHADMALAGGVSISFPQRRATEHQDGGMASADGHCRPFDAAASGTVFGAGAGMVMLKRLDDAIADGDHIYAVILGHGINNDGGASVGYAAPSIEGQQDAIAAAHRAAGVDAESIRYIECHGTGTPLGDPIEIAALTNAFRLTTQEKQFCAIGSLKSAIGHLDIAAGVTGIIKTALCLHEKKLPPTLHFTTPNPHSDLANSPFYVNNSLTEWTSDRAPRRAGVSAFGLGGTNVHMVLEEAPTDTHALSSRPSHLLLLSARSEAALAAQHNSLATWLHSHPAADLEDVGYTLATGRRAFPWRSAVTAASAQDATALLASPHPRRISDLPSGEQKIAFLFPGQGAQYPGMGRQLYDTESAYRNVVDLCAEILEPLMHEDIRAIMYPATADAEAADRLRQTRYAQPALFVTSYAAAHLWMEWGIAPDFFAGHSVGEYVGACLGGVFMLEDALRIIALRGQWMQSMPEGDMLAVKLSEEKARALLDERLSIAAVNSPSLCVVSGPRDAIAQFEDRLKQDGHTARRLHTSHAFHSAMVDPVIEPLHELLSGITLHPSSIPIFSCVTAQQLTSSEATSPRYWARHCRETVRFYPAIQALDANTPAVYLEVGPGTTLATLVRQSLSKGPDRLVTGSIPPPDSADLDTATMQSSLGAMWTRGIDFDPQGYFAHQSPRRISLPSTPFERKRFWVEQHASSGSEAITSAPPLSAATTASTDSPVIANPLPTEDPSPMTTATTDPKDRLNAELAGLFDELSGVPISNEGCTTDFMELGFDSLFLTQVTQEIQRRYGVKVTFRQMLEDVSSIDALSAHILPQLAPEIQARLNATPTSPATPASGPLPAVMAAQTAPASPLLAAAMAAQFPPSAATVPATGLEALLQQQLKAMTDLLQQQFQVLANASASTAPPVPQSQVPPAPPQATATPASAAQPSVELRTTSRFSQRPKADKDSHAVSTPEQQKFLDALITRYCAKTAGSKRYAQQYRRSLADPRSVSGFRPEWKELIYSIVCERSAGSRLYDIDGNEYIDLLNGFGPTMFGHEPAFVVEAVKEQLGKSFAIGPHTPLAGETAELVCELTGAERVTFCNTGSEAVMAAMRAARTVTGRDRVVFFAGDYHGQFDEVLVKGIRRGDEYSTLPIAPGIPRKNVENVTVLEYGEPDALAWIEKHAAEIAAVIVEPAQSRHPALQPREFLHNLRDLTTRIGSALVFDEVVTGFRIHSGGAQAYYGVQADMATYGKVAGGGLPIGILAGKAQYMDAFDGGFWQFGDSSYPEAGVTFFAGTFVRHPLAIAATHATLLHIKNAGPALYDEMEAKSAAFAARLDAIFARAGLPVTLERCGSIMYFHFPQEAKFSSLFYFLLREKGVFYLEGFPLYLTTAHSAADLEHVYRAFTESLAEMQAVGLLPGAPAPAPEVLPEEITLTAPQLEIMLAAQAGEEPNCAFNESFSVYLDGPLNEDHLRSAWSRLIERHESLRMHLNASGDAMCIEPAADIPLQPIDLSSLAPDQQKLRIQEIVEAEGKTPFNLQSGPLVRAKLIRFAPDRHQLIITAHHIVCDGWSINVLVDEWGRIYSSLIRGGEPDLLPVMRYSDYARQSAPESPEKSAAEDFWKAEFQTIPDLMDLPTDSTRRADRTFTGSTHFAQFSPELTKAVRKAGAAHGCTLFVTLLGTWQIVLSRLSGQPEPVTLIPSAAQSQFENCSLVGHCVHLLPIRSQVQPHESAASFLRTVKQRVLNAYDHQQVTYGSLVHSIHAPAPAGRLPLSEVQFNLERLAGAVSFEGLKTRVQANGKQFVNFDIFLNIVESPEGLRLECDYNTDLYREETIARWLDHYRTLLEAFALNAQTETAALPLLNESLRHALVTDLNNTEAPYPEHASIPSLIARQAQLAPDSVAVEFYGRKLSRRQLEESANRVAEVLLSNGIGKQHLVGLYIERSLDMVIALLGVLKAGAGYVPLDPLFPRERIDAILQATDMAVLLTLDAHIAELPDTNTPMITMESIRASLAVEHGEVEQPAADSTAYVIFTSGSTGTPKGVEITHRSVVNLLYAAAKEIDFHAGDRLLAVTTLTFDIAALELLLPLAFGGTTVIARHQDSADGVHLLSLLKASQCNILQATPITWRMLLDSGFTSWPGFKMLCGGESWTRDLANRLLSGGGRLWNMYGPTETTIWSSISEVLPGDAPILIGRPIANTQFYVLDEQMQPVPPGVAGELYIGGDGLARGYYNNPEVTAVRFPRNPFAGDPHVRIYKTGDLVRQSIDGGIEFLRRTDHQIKLRGFRIELGEVERAIASCVSSQQVAVMLRTTPSGDPTLVAYLIPQDPSEFDAEALRAALFLRLPEYMVPTWFIPLPAFPLTANGKVDRKNLPLPEWQTVTRKSEIVAPSTPTQRLLAEIWSEVLGIQEIGIDDSLLALGADSLRIFQIASRCNRRGLPVTARQLMKLKTIRAIESELETAPSSGNLAGMGPIRKAPRNQYAPVATGETVAS